MDTMGSCKYLLIFSTFILNLVCFGFTRGVPLDEEIDKKYIAYEDTVLLLKNITNYNTSEDFWGIVDAPIEFKGSARQAQKFLSVENETIEERVKFFLHTPEEPKGIQLNPKNTDDIKFNPSHPTKIIVHGWLSGADTKMIQGIARAYLTNGDYNVITVDWSSYSSDLIYPNPAKATKYVGEYIACFIDSLVEERKARHSEFHVIGHSLGAHVAGFVGNFTKERIGRITGLDPALPGFQYLQGPEGRLDPSDAAFVDIIHTCSGVLGMSVPAGHADFFPNGGSPLQPGCTTTIDPQQIKTCSHGRAKEFFKESIVNKSAFRAIACKDWNHFKSHSCDQIYALMGEHVSKDTQGIFYLKTQDHFPFGKGQEGTVY